MKEQLTQKVVLAIIALSTFLLGVSGLLIGEHNHIKLVTDFYGVSGLLSAGVFNFISVAAFLVAALLSVITIFHAKLLRVLGVWLMLISLVPLLSLFASTMWIESLGGFPAIGSGQGTIKYFALLSVGYYFFNKSGDNKRSQWIQVIPVIIVLLWIGGMKFTLLEAKGIEALVASSPLMSWMYNIWDLQMTSNVIGVYDLVVVAILIAAILNNRFIPIAILSSGAVFIVTQTFLLTWGAALSAETILSTGGHFLIKDLWFIANLILLHRLVKQAKNGIA